MVHILISVSYIKGFFGLALVYPGLKTIRGAAT